MISRDEVKHLADLAHLELSEQELEKMTRELGLILDYISQLKEIDVSKIEPMSGGHSLVNIFRQNDSEKDSFAFDPEQLKQQFPKKQGDYNKVPKIIEK
ncbi:MAG: Asp-tRNA(Asn)/Glu-tRNA(Gln) amidotransferase subunit GatC [Patescibacteria group bacterium]